MYSLKFIAVAVIGADAMLVKQKIQNHKLEAACNPVQKKVDISSQLDIFTVSYNMAGNIDQIDTIAEHLVDMSQNEAVKVFAFQEIFELSTGFGAVKQLYNGAFSADEYTTAIQFALKQRLDAQGEYGEYVLVEDTRMWAQYTVVFAKHNLVDDARVQAVAVAPWKPSWTVGNKGAVGINITIYKKSVLVLNVHLPSGDGLEADGKRMKMYREIQHNYASYHKDDQENKKNVIALGDFNARLSTVSGDALTDLFKNLRDMQKFINEPESQNIDIVEALEKTNWVHKHCGKRGGHLDRFAVAAKANARNAFQYLFEQQTRTWYTAGLWNRTTRDADKFAFDLVEANKNWMPTYKIERNVQKVNASAKQHKDFLDRYNTKVTKRPSSLFETVDTGKKDVNGRKIELHYKRNQEGMIYGSKDYVPSWTDRIFFHGHEATAAKNIKHYKCDHTLTASDHSPVSAVITLTAWLLYFFGDGTTSTRPTSHGRTKST